jgi:hypothetical protein
VLATHAEAVDQALSRYPTWEAVAHAMLPR